MKKLLIINASARKTNSHSRKLTEVFIQQWNSLHKDAVIRQRELGNTNVPHLTDEWIIANFTPPARRTEKELEVLSISNSYIAELREADIIVLGTPMYNWSIPSTLKAYIDQIMRLNETFKMNPGDPTKPYLGLLQNKTVVLLVTRGFREYEPGERDAHLNFQTSYLKTVLNIVGIEDIYTIAVNGTSLSSEELEDSFGQAHRQVRAVIEELKWQ